MNSVSGGINKEFLFTDITDDTFNAAVAANTTKLLANIILKPATGVTEPQPGDVYSLTFITAGTSLYEDTLNPISFNKGTLTVPMQVPEPSVFGMASVAAVILLNKLWPIKSND